MQPGPKLQVGLSIDEAPYQEVQGVAMTANLVRIPLASNSVIFERFKQGHLLKLRASDRQEAFMLTDTSRVLPVLLNCVRSALNPAPLQHFAMRSTVPCTK